MSKSKRLSPQQLLRRRILSRVSRVGRELRDLVNDLKAWNARYPAQHFEIDEVHRLQASAGHTLHYIEAELPQAEAP